MFVYPLYKGLTYYQRDGLANVIFNNSQVIRISVSFQSKKLTSVLMQGRK